MTQITFDDVVRVMQAQADEQDKATDLEAGAYAEAERYNVDLDSIRDGMIERSGDIYQAAAGYAGLLAGLQLGLERCRNS